jgi:ribosomal protein S18 acetylase RimI-like enzyme
MSSILVYASHACRMTSCGVAYAKEASGGRDSDRGRSVEVASDKRGVRHSEAKYHPSMKIEVLADSMKEQAVSLWYATGVARPWNDPADDLHRALTGSASTVLACTERDQLVGTAMVGHDGHRGWVYYLAVVPSRQRQGVGRKLMEACEEWARDRGVPKIQVMIRRSNTDVFGFYEQLGYTDDQVSVLGRRLDS